MNYWQSAEPHISAERVMYKTAIDRGATHVMFSANQHGGRSLDMEPAIREILAICL